MAKEARARISIYADNQLKSGLNDAKKDLTSFSSFTDGLNKKITGLFKFTAIATGVKAVVKGVSELTKAGIGAADEFDRLSRILNSKIDATNLISTMDRLDDISKATKEDLSSFGQELIAMGKSGEEAAKILEAAVAAANVTGQDFSTVSSAMSKAINGSNTAINRILPQFKDLKKEAWATGEAFEKVIDGIGQLGTDIGVSSTAQQLEGITNSWQRIKENIGQGFKLVLDDSGILGVISRWLQMIEMNTAQTVTNSKVRRAVADGLDLTEVFTPQQIGDTFRDLQKSMERDQRLKIAYESGDSAVYNAVYEAAVKVGQANTKEELALVEETVAQIREDWVGTVDQMTENAAAVWEANYDARLTAAEEAKELYAEAIRAIAAATKEAKTTYAEIVKDWTQTEEGMAAYQRYAMQDGKMSKQPQSTYMGDPVSFGDEIIIGTKAFTIVENLIRDAVESGVWSAVSDADLEKYVEKFAGSSYWEEIAPSRVEWADAAKEILDYRRSVGMENAKVFTFGTEADFIANYLKSMALSAPGDISDFIEDYLDSLGLKDLGKEWDYINSKVDTSEDALLQKIEEYTESYLSGKMAERAAAFEASRTKSSGNGNNGDDDSNGKVEEATKVYTNFIKNINESMVTKLGDIGKSSYQKALDSLEEAREKMLNEVDEDDNKIWLATDIELWYDEAKTATDEYFRAISATKDSVLGEYNSYMTSLADGITELVNPMTAYEQAMAEVEVIITELAGKTDEFGNLLYTEEEIAKLRAEAVVQNMEYYKTLSNINKKQGKSGLLGIMQKLNEETDKLTHSYTDFDLALMQIDAAIEEMSNMTDEFGNALYTVEELAEMAWDAAEAAKRNAEAKYKPADNSKPGSDIDLGPLPSAGSAFSVLMGDATSELATLFQGMGTEVWLASQVLADFSQMGGVIQPIFDTLNKGLNPLQWIVSILEGFSNVILPALQAVLEPITSFFTLIGEAIGSWFIPLLDSVGSQIANLVQMLSSVLMPILQMLAPIFETLGLVGDALSGVFALLTKAIIVVMSPLQWLGDAFSWVAEWVKYFGKCIKETISHLFDLRNADFSGKPGSFSSDAFSGLGERLAMVDSYGDNRASMAANAGLTSAVQNASYTGGGTVHLTVNIEGNVVGSNGMTELAKLLRTEFEALSYYGI